MFVFARNPTAIVWNGAFKFSWMIRHCYQWRVCHSGVNIEHESVQQCAFVKSSLILFITTVWACSEGMSDSHLLVTYGVGIYICVCVCVCMCVCKREREGVKETQGLPFKSSHLNLMEYYILMSVEYYNSLYFLLSLKVVHTKVKRVNVECSPSRAWNILYWMD